MNRVDKIALHLVGEDEVFFKDLHSDFNMTWSTLLERATDRVLQKWSSQNMHLEIEELVLDLPPITDIRFRDEFIVHYEALLESQLLKVIRNPKSQEAGVNVKYDRIQLLFHYLLHGNLLWKPSDGSFDLQDLFLEILQKNGDELAKFLRTYGHYTSLQERIIYRLEEKSLIEGVKLLVPNDYQFVLNYVKSIQRKYKLLNKPYITETNYKKAVWQVIYAYVLTRQTTYFNKKMFVKQTIAGIGNHYNLNYNHLLRILSIDEKVDHISGELYLILKNLFEEEQVVFKRKNWKSWIQLVLQMSGTLLEGVKKDKEVLIPLLKSHNSIYLLQLLSEQEIFSLVNFIVPNDAVFIQNYVTTLDDKQQNGLLEGKAGGEFYLLKWQIIFPILLQNNGANFNRKYFVEQVLVKIAAHYNLELTQLLTYWNLNDKIFERDKILLKIWKDLLNKYNVDIPKSSLLASLRKEDILLAIKQNVQLTIGQIDVLKVWVKSITDNLQIIGSLSVIEIQGFIKLNFKKDTKWISYYASHLNLLEKSEGSRLQSMSQFTNIKWTFIFQVLVITNQNVFNKKYFVLQTIAKLAAHYNIKKEILIDILTKNIEQVLSNIPYDLFVILNELKNDSLRLIKSENNAFKPEPVNEMIGYKENELIRLLDLDVRSDALIATLFKSKADILYLKPILDILFRMVAVFNSQISLKIDKKKSLLVIAKYRESYPHHSHLDVIRFIISWLLNQVHLPSVKSKCLRELVTLSANNVLLKQAIKSITIETNMNEIRKEELQSQIGTYQEVYNVGIILIAAYLPRLFSILKYTSNGAFCDEEKQIRAIFLMQYLISGKTECEEYELLFYRILTGTSLSIALPNTLDLTIEEMEVSNQMLASILMHWQKVKSIDALREGFLQRGGLLIVEQDILELKVHPKAFDMLLDFIPWSYKTTKFSWMEKAIVTHWR